MEAFKEVSPQWKGAHLMILWPLPAQEGIVEKIGKATGLRVTWKQALFKLEDETVFQDVDIIATLAALPTSRSVCPKLKLGHTMTAGVDYVSRSPLFKDPNIRWSYASGIHGPAMAEWVFMTYMQFNRNWDASRDSQRRKEWTGFQFKAFVNRDLVGQRVGILGYGSIGRQVARVAKAMAMDVIAFTASPRETSDSRRDTSYRLPGTGDPEGTMPIEWYHGLDKESLHHFLAQNIDLLVVCVPITEQTRGLLGEEEFDIFAKHSPYGGAFISNIARGDVLVQDELITALKTEGSGVRGAALDVQTPEPLPPDSALWDAPNCFITPHSSSQNDRYVQRALGILVENLRKPDGEDFINEVNRGRGY